MRWIIRIGVPGFLGMFVIGLFSDGWFDAIRVWLIRFPVAACFCGVLVIAQGVAVPRAAEAPGKRRRVGQAATLLALAGGIALVVVAVGRNAMPLPAEVSLAAIVWFTGTVLALADVTIAAERLEEPGLISWRIARRAQSGFGVLLMGSAAAALLGFVAAVSYWFGLDMRRGTATTATQLGSILTLVRAGALVMAAYAWVGLAFWAVIFELMAANVGRMAAGGISCLQHRLDVSSGGVERVGELGDELAAGLGEIGPAAPLAADGRRRPLDPVAGRDAAGFELT